ncbi:MAG: endonuclease/exonuclease/phosphatase family protein [Actinomycetota bacterium]|nr:endonuclease/exonuclease/phosphatase family protein [Actinomycetota bacterium]
MSVLVRSWNLFHGNTKPSGRVAHLERMVRLAVEGDPEIVLLQEVPGWALRRLEDWSGYAAIGDVAAPPTLGPLPSTYWIGKALTTLNPGLLRSAFSGQANAILLARRLSVSAHERLVLNPGDFRRREARRLGLGLVARLAWAGERRVCQAVRVALPDGRSALVANLHATSYPPDHRLPEAELRRAAAWVDGLAGMDDIVVLGGDLNQSVRNSPFLEELERAGYSAPGRGIDHILVRGAELERPLSRWPDERRLLDGKLLSDHAPVEVTIR